MQYIDRGVCFIELEQAFAGEFTKPIDSVHSPEKWILASVIWLSGSSS
jgi:hypothetical protein